MAFTAVAAIIEGGIAAAGIGTILTAVAEVGVAMSVVGAVTGSKDLMKIGAVLGLAGGIGGLVNGAIGAAESGVALGGVGGSMGAAGDFGLNAATGAAGTADAVVGSSFAALPTGGMAATGELGGALGSSAASGAAGELGSGLAGSGATDIASSMGVASNGTVAPSIGTSLGDVTGSAMNVGAPAAIDAPAAISSPNTPSAMDVNAVNTPGGSTGLSDVAVTGGDATRASLYGNEGYGGLTQKVPSSSFFGDISAWAKANPDMLKLGSGVLQGIGKAYDTNRVMSFHDQQLALSQQQAANGRAVPVGSFGINAGAQVSNPYKPTGIIAGVRG